MMRRTLAVLALALAPAVVSAQGTLSTQGLGFPPGQLSTAARSMGGSIGEADPYSPLNPAAIGVLTSAIVMMQAEPEYRKVQIGNNTAQRTSVARFPLFQGALPLGSRWALGVSASTLLDRTWETTSRDSQFIPDTIRSTVTERSEGAIADLRLAIAYSPMAWLKLGIAGHAYSGRDQIRAIREFDDTARFAADTQGTNLSFGGNALSVGAMAFKARVGALGVSYRKGSGISTEVSGTTVSSATVPDRFGVSAVYMGVRGAAFAVRAARDKWSALEGLRSNLNIHEGWDMGVGADVTGPTVGSSAIALRAGGRWRTLPFSIDDTPVKETTFSGGFSLPIARNRVELALGAMRSARTGTGATETAWTWSTGFSIRP
jgi:hypothetical protein